MDTLVHASVQNGLLKLTILVPYLVYEIVESLYAQFTGYDFFLDKIIVR